LAVALYLYAVAAVVRPLWIERAHWTPFEARSPFAVVFTHYRLADAIGLWHELARHQLLWSIGFVALLMLAGIVGDRFGRAGVALVLTLQSIALCALLLAPLPLDSDQYAYVGYGDLVWAGHNPYAPPVLRADAPIQLRAVASHWGNPIFADRYGAVWSAVNALLLWPFHGLSVDVQARVERIIAALATLGCSLMLLAALRDAPLRLAALTAFALNPLVLLSSALGAHNDVYAVLLGLAAYALATSGRFASSGGLLALAAGVKFAYAPFIVPLIGFAYNRLGLAKAAGAAAVFAAITAISVAPFGFYNALIAPLQYVQSRQSHIAYFAWRAATRIPGMQTVTPSAFAWLEHGVLAVTIIVIAVLAIRGRRSYPLECFALILVFLAADKIEPWYAVLLAPLVLLPSTWYVVLFAAISLAAQVFERPIFTGPTASWPYAEFYALAILLTIVLGAGFALRGAVLKRA